MSAASSDFEQLQRVTASIQEHVQRAKINPNQCRVFHRRLRVIYDTLLRMPKREPTPQLLSVFRAADFTFGRMGKGRWRHVLIQLFTCNAQFECLRGRIRGVWSLHSTVMWEKEDKEAMAADEEHNLGVIMTDASLMPAMLAQPPSDESTLSDSLRDTLLHHYRRRHASQWKLLVDELQYAPALPDEDGNTGDPHSSWGTEEVFSKPPPEVLEDIHPDVLSSPGAPSASGGGNSSSGGVPNPMGTSPGLGGAYISESADFGSPLFHNSSLLPLGDTIEMLEHLPNSFTAASTAAALVGGSTAHQLQLGGSVSVAPSRRAVGTLATRFFVKYEGLRYRGQHVVVKRLREAELINPTTLEAFVMDSSVRVRWSHPNLVTTHGSFCEEFDDGGIPRLSLGMVMTNLCRAPERYVPLQRLLFLEGRRFSLLEAIDITLQAADALQYTLFDQGDVPTYVADRWGWVSPSNIFLLDSSPWDDGMGAGGGGSNNDITETFSIAVQDLQNTQEDVGLAEMTAMQGRYAVKYSPPVYVEGGGVVSRWAPHPLAVNTETYALAQLFVALCTNLQPYHYISCQLELQSMFQAARGATTATTATNVLPQGIRVPSTLPADVQYFCRNAMALKSEITTGRVASPIKTLATFRAALHNLREYAMTLPQLPHGDPSKTSFVVQSAVDDYGWILHQPFDEHAA
ncbi:Hypothetical protein, putative [Bodo saltans]|uniref:Protein kinase n=1 Tax=Bodo saltans TaxID=75058 RepID=A0A0S4IKW2_BODSA|nr:Hypothetical protein, putative [Bodo saltans]|eukprot:CUF15384.1 Hypothetical protein, putative [Bodo saltans]